MSWCTAQWKMLLFCAKIIMKVSSKFELAHLRKERNKTFFCLATFWFGIFDVFCATRSLVGHENT